MNRFFKNIPLYEFDEHNEAFYYWHKAKYEGYIQEPVDLFHIDAHSDAGVPKILKKSIYPPDYPGDNHLRYYKDFAENELNIDNFILPAVLSGLVKNIYFIHPPWRNFKPVRKKMNIASAFGEGKILKYNLDFKKSPNPQSASKVLPDLKYFNYYLRELGRVPKNRKVILDIDLDYFACRDSALDYIDYELEITPQQFLNRESFLSNKTLKFSRLEFSFEEKEGRYYVKVGHKKNKEISYLPSKGEIEFQIDTLVSTLDDKKIMPVVITICKSCVSGYCPDGYSEFIAERLKQRLKLFGDIN